MAGSNMAVDVMVRLKDRLSGPLGRLKSRLGQFAKFLKVTMVGAAAAFTAALTGSIFEAIKFQRLWAEANKTLGMSSHELNLLKNDLDDLSFKIPLTRQEFAEMAEQAGNIGIRGRENIVEFIDLAAIMGSTFDGVDPKQGAQFLGNWRESLGYTQAELRTTVDQINHLGNSTNAGAGPLAKFASDSLALGDAAGYAREETLALGAAVIAAGKAPEVATTGFRAMNRFLTAGNAGLSKAQRGIVSSLGLDMDQIQKQMQTDATGAIRNVVEAINKMPIEKRTSIVNQLFGDEAQRVFGPMLTDITKLEAALARIDDLRKNSAGSAQKEFDGVSDTVSANWQKLKNVFSAMRDEAGQPYLEPINTGLKFMIDLLTSLDERVTIFDRIGTAASGFFRGLGFGRARNGAKRLWKTLEPVKDFLFGTKGGDAGEQLAKQFSRAERAGARLKQAIDGLARLALPYLNRGLKALTGFELPELKGLLIDKGKAAGLFILGEAMTALGVAIEMFQSLKTGIVTGFMDNIGDGLARWQGMEASLSDLGSSLSEIILPLGKAFGDLYNSIKQLVTIDESGMSGIESFGQVLGTLAAGAVGVAGESLKLVVKLITGVATALTQISNWMQGEPVDWGKLKGAGFDILSQIGDLINSILDPLGKLIGMDLTIDWAALAALKVAWEGLKALGSGFMTGFMDNIKDGLKGWDGLGTDVSAMGTALGDLYSSIKKLVTVDEDGMKGIESFGQVLGTLAAGAVGVAGESLKLVVKLITGVATALTQISNWMQGEPVDWGKLKGAGFDILSDIGDLINAILEPLGKLLDMDLSIDWSQLTNGLTEIVNGAIDKLNWLIEKLNKLPGVNIDSIGKFDLGPTTPTAANDNAPGGKPSAVSLPPKLETRNVSPKRIQSRIDKAFGSVPAATTGGADNVQKVEFAPLEHEVTSKVEVGGGVQISVIGPAKVTSTNSTNPNAPVTVNTGRAVGRN